MDIKVHADGVTSNDSGAGVNGRVDPNASSTGVSKNRSGYLVYLANDAGQVTSPVVLVPYNLAPASTVDTGYIKSRVGNVLCIDVYQGTMKDATGGFDKPPFTVDGGKFGTALANYLKAMDGTSAKAYEFIENVLGEQYKAQFRSGEQKLVIEAVAWTGFVSGGDLYAYTAKTGAEIVSTYNYSYLGKFWKQRLPKCGFLKYDWCGVSAPDGIPSGDIVYNSIIDKGWGLIMLTPFDAPKEDEPVEISTKDYLRANELNYYFGDFIEGGSAGRTFDSYIASLNMGAKVYWNKHTGSGFQNSKLKDGKWSIEEGVSSSIENFHGTDNILYRSGAGTYTTRTAPKIFAEDSGKQYPGYGYMYSRALFGDDLVVCDYKGNGYSYKNFIEGRLKLK